MACCTEITDLGCFTSCDTEVETDLVADVTGEWSLEADFAGSVVKKTFDAVITEKIMLPNVFNEDYTTVFRLYHPDGTQFGGVCYSLTMKPQIFV